MSKSVLTLFEEVAGVSGADGSIRESRLSILESNFSSGGADEGSDDDEGFVALTFQVDPRELPQMWSTIAMDIRDVLRHEIEN